jgi:hypothetical protein
MIRNDRYRTRKAVDMKTAPILLAVLFISFILIVFPGKKINQNKDYRQLLKQFPENKQGYSQEVGLSLKSHQPMTYALVLSSEVFHFRARSEKESRRRITNAVHWLVEHADQDKDGEVGWGLPQSWDAFSDGTVNKKNHPYTITTAIVIQSLLDALSLPGFWDQKEAARIRDTVDRTAYRWCTQLWTEKPWGGYFWYSPAAWDAHFVPNVSAMFLGVLARYVKEHKSHLSKQALFLFNSRTDQAALGIIKMAKWNENRPYWDYTALSISPVKNRPNDLVHHTYIIWGMELYRIYRGKVILPWSPEQALSTLDLFWRKGKLYDFPLSDPENKEQPLSQRERPANIWGAGIMLAFYAKHGTSQKTKKCMDYIKLHYGPLDRLRLFPDWFSEDDAFYHRFAAHVLYGMACSFYSRRGEQLQ